MKVSGFQSLVFHSHEDYLTVILSMLLFVLASTVCKLDSKFRTDCVWSESLHCVAWHQFLFAWKVYTCVCTSDFFWQLYIVHPRCQLDEVQYDLSWVVMLVLNSANFFWYCWMEICTLDRQPQILPILRSLSSFFQTILVYSLLSAVLQTVRGHFSLHVLSQMPASSPALSRF